MSLVSSRDGYHVETGVLSDLAGSGTDWTTGNQVINPEA